MRDLFGARASCSDLVVCRFCALALSSAATNVKTWANVRTAVFFKFSVLGKKLRTVLNLFLLFYFTAFMYLIVVFCRISCEITRHCCFTHLFFTQLDEEKDNAVTSFFRKGFKNKTWWEEANEEEMSTNWRT